MEFNLLKTPASVQSLTMNVVLFLCLSAYQGIGSFIDPW